MAATIARLFRTRKNHKGIEEGDKRCCPDNSMLGVDRVRLLIFKDHDLTGRDVVFDSGARMCKPAPPAPPPKNAKSAKPVNTSISSTSGKTDASQGANPPKPACRNSQGGVRSGNDVKLLGEMMFGALPICNKATTFKVHLIKSPPRLMITKVFVPSHQATNQCGPSVISSVSSTATVSAAAVTSTTADFTASAPVSLEHQSYDLYKIHMIPSDEYSAPTYPSMPPLSEASAAINISNQQKSPTSCGLASSVPNSLVTDPGLLDSGEDYQLSESGALSLTSSLNLSSSSAALDTIATSSGPSSLNLHIGTAPGPLFCNRMRRLHRHQITQLEGNPELLQLENQAANLLPLHKRPTKIGLGVIFTLSDINSAETKNFQNFIFSHMILIENYLHKLKVSIDGALATSNSSEFICEAMNTFLHCIRSLHTAARLPSPVWLSLVTQNSAQFRVGVKFLTDFMWLVEKCDTKNSRFFLSSVITAVLTHHLSWVSTVSPAGDSPSKAYLNKHMPTWLYSLARSHPYNPLWAQLGDLCGAIGFPLRISRTIVIGQKPELVSKLLNVLSYFIRCSDIIESNELQIDLDCYKNVTEIVKDSKESIQGGVGKPPVLHKVPLISNHQNKEGDESDLDSMGNKFVDVVMKQLSEAMLPKTGVVEMDEPCSEALQIYEEDNIRVSDNIGESFQLRIGEMLPDGQKRAGNGFEDTKVPADLCHLAKYQIIEESRVERETPVRKEDIALHHTAFQNSNVGQTLNGKVRWNSTGNQMTNRNSIDCGISSLVLNSIDHKTSAPVSHSGSQAELKFTGSKQEDLPQLSLSHSLCDISTIVGNNSCTSIEMFASSGALSGDKQMSPGGALSQNRLTASISNDKVECAGMLSQHRLPLCQRLYPDLSKVRGDMSELSPSQISSFLAPSREHVVVVVPNVRVSRNSASDSTSPCTTLKSVGSWESLHSDSVVVRKNIELCNKQPELTIVGDKGAGQTLENVFCSKAEVTFSRTLESDGVSESIVSGGPIVRGSAVMPKLEYDSGLESLDNTLHTFPISIKQSNQTSMKQCYKPDEIDSKTTVSDVIAARTLAQQTPSGFSGIQRGTSLFDDLYDNPKLDLSAIIKDNLIESDYSTTSTANISLRIDSDLHLNLMDSCSCQSEASDSNECCRIRSQRVSSDDACHDDLDVDDDSGISAEHFSSVSIEVRRERQESDIIDQLPVSESASQLRSTIELMKDVASQRRQRHSSGQSQTSSVMCRSSSPTDFGGVGGLCRCTSVASNTTDCLESSCPAAFNNFTELPLVMRDSSLATADFEEDVSLICRESFVTVTATASTAAAAAASATAAAVAADRPTAAASENKSNSTRARISYDYNFGRSLMAGICSHYMSDFILHGTRDRSVLNSPYTQLHTDLKASVQNSIVDEPVAEASCITADVDKWCVQLFSCKYNSSDQLSVHQLTSSQLVCECVEAIHDLWKLKVSPEFCIVHLEDRLQQIYLKSKILAEFIKVHRKLYSKDLAALHGFDMSDMPLLLAVAVTHSPDIVLALMDDLP